MGIEIKVDRDRPRERPSALLNYLAADANDFVTVPATALLSPVPFMSPAIALLSRLHGYFSNSEPSSGVSSFFPGVGTSRYIRQRRKLSRDVAGRGSLATLGERAGGASAIILASALGALVGGIYGVRKGIGLKAGAGLGGMIGTGVGSAAQFLVGPALAAATDTRTIDEQRNYENSKTRQVMNWVLPGASSYNDFKSLGFMENSRDY